MVELYREFPAGFQDHVKDWIWGFRRTAKLHGRQFTHPFLTELNANNKFLLGQNLGVKGAAGRQIPRILHWPPEFPGIRR